jgi:hypothetical protein
MAGSRADEDPLSVPDVSPEELLESMPPDVMQALPRFAWSVEDLWKLERPSETFPVDRFAWLIDLPIWRWRGRRWQISMRDVLDHPEQYRAHHEKSERSDARYPIHVTFHNGRWIILDGYHRLLKTLSRGQAIIKVVRVQADDF